MKHVALVLALLCCAGDAVADTTDADSPAARAAARSSAGADAYGAQDYPVAIAAFAEAYRLDPDPTYLFNLAQAQRRGARCADALASYSLYLERVPSAANRSEIEGWVVEQEACVAAIEAARPVAREHRVTPSRTPPIIAAVATAATGTLAAIFYVVARGHGSDAGDYMFGDAYNAEVDAAHRYQALAITGGVLTAVGAGLTGYLWYRTRPRTIVEIGPSAAGDGGQVSLRASF